MAGRPQRKRPANPAKRRAPAPLAPRREPLDSARLSHGERGKYDRGGGMVRVEPREMQQPVYLSRAYADALNAEVPLADALDPDRTVESLVRDSAARNRGKVRLSDIVAAQMLGRAIDRTTRDGVPAAKELADRTEGPVVQRVQTVSTRFVVSLTPGGGPVEPSPPLSTEEWERLAAGSDRAEEEAQVARLGISTASAQPVEFRK